MFPIHLLWSRFLWAFYHQEENKCCKTVRCHLYLSWLKRGALPVLAQEVCILAQEVCLTCLGSRGVLYLSWLKRCASWLKRCALPVLAQEVCILAQEVCLTCLGSRGVLYLFWLNRCASRNSELTYYIFLHKCFESISQLSWSS